MDAAPFILPEGDRLACVSICDLLAEGLSLNKICKMEGFPAKSTFLGWVLRDNELADQYTRARDIQADILVDEINDIADDSTADFGFAEGTDKDGDGAKKVFLKEHVQRAKLRIDTRKWQAGKQRPKKYGDSIRHEGEIALSISDKLKEARDRATSGS